MSHLIPRLMSGAALAGGGLAATLCLAVTFGALHGAGTSSGVRIGSYERDMASEFRASLMLPKAPVSAESDRVALQNRVFPKWDEQAKKLQDVALKTPQSRPLDSAGRAILEQALAASIAERALAERWNTDTGAQLALAAVKPITPAMPAQQVAAAILKNAAPLTLAQGLPAQLQPVAASQIAASSAAPAPPPPVQVAMLPDSGPAPVMRPREDPFVKVLADKQVAAGDKPAAKTIPLKQAPEKTAPKTLMAYARSEDVMDGDDSPSIFSRRASLPGRGSGIAVYDISAATVYMPSGEKLRAHSGRGENRDNPRSAPIKNRGVTPPNIYRLTMRESLFHGVEALRMTPVGGNNMYGRDGFLTHTFLLRVRGDSSGCVVFEQYPRFLNAYKRGEVKTLIVVPSVSELPKYMAKL
ncbi:hypothetical protein H4S14_001986 [Agrobacterium vitis]|nr:hypothetical protein [Agrobacterium vitis]MBE1438241.1 hypothetical protein [Agrobacterium vitis]